MRQAAIVDGRAQHHGKEALALLARLVLTHALDGRETGVAAAMLAHPPLLDAQYQAAVDLLIRYAPDC